MLIYTIYRQHVAGVKYFRKKNDKNIYMNYNEVIRQLRHERNLTQQQLADAIGFSESMVRKWESGKKKPSFDAIVALSKFFKVPAGYVMGIED